MDHSSKLNPYTIIAQSESAIKNITQCNGELQQLKKSVLSFADDSYIKSDAFDMLKEYAAEIPGLIDRIIECNESDIGDYRTLASSVGDEVLIGSIILDNKNRYYRLWWDATQKADMYRAKAQSAINPSMQNVLQGLANYYVELATQYHSLFVYWRTKEEKYDQIERNSLFLSNITMYQGMEENKDSLVTNKIQIGKSYITNGKFAYNVRSGVSGEMINDWLFLGNERTNNTGRKVELPANFDRKKCYSREEKENINKYARDIIGDSNDIIMGSCGELFDRDGRYWIAVGPNVMNPNHNPSQDITLEEMKYGTKIDVVLENDEGETKVIYCVVGDCKAHTYPNGIVQTGRSFKEPNIYCGSDGSIIEFIGNGSLKELKEYSLEEVIVYDGIEE